MTTHFKLATGLAAAILFVGAGGAFAATTLDNDTNVMARANSNSKLIGTLTAGATVTVAAQNSNWCRLSSPTAGWVACSDIEGLGARTNVAPAAQTPAGYDYDTDPVLGPHGGFHTAYEGHYQ